MVSVPLFHLLKKSFYFAVSKKEIFTNEEIERILQMWKDDILYEINSKVLPKLQTYLHRLKKTDKIPGKKNEDAVEISGFFIPGYLDELLTSTPIIIKHFNNAPYLGIICT